MTDAHSNYTIQTDAETLVISAASADEAAAAWGRRTGRPWVESIEDLRDETEDIGDAAWTHVVGPDGETILDTDPEARCG